MVKEYRCPRCEGTGFITDIRNMLGIEPHKFLQTTTCPRCGGTGRDHSINPPIKTKVKGV